MSLEGILIVADQGQAWGRLQAGPERAVGVRLALHLVLLVQPALQLRRVVAAVRLCPILGQPLAPLHHAVVLRPPRRVPDHPDVQPHQPQGKERREIAARPPGIAVVYPQRHRSTPLPEAAAQLGLHHSGGHLGEVALGGKHGCSALPPSIHQPPEASKSSGHRPGVSGRRHRPPTCRAGARPAANSCPAADRVGPEPNHAGAASAGWFLVGLYHVERPRETLCRN